MTTAHLPRTLIAVFLALVILTLMAGILRAFIPVRADTPVTPSTTSSPQQEESVTPTPTVEPSPSPTLPTPTPSLTVSLTPTEKPPLTPTEEPTSTPTPLPKSADTSGVLGLGAAIVVIILVGSLLGMIRLKMK